MSNTQNLATIIIKILNLTDRRLGNNPNNKLDRIVAKFESILDWTCILLLFIQVSVVVYVVFGRFVLSKTPVWGEEIALLAMVWLSLFSVAIGEMDSSHINISLIEKILPKKIIKIRDLIFHIMNLFFSSFLIIEGFKLSYKIRHAVMPGSKLPLWILYLSVPISSIFLFLVIVKKVIKKES